MLHPGCIIVVSPSFDESLPKPCSAGASRDRANYRSTAAWGVRPGLASSLRSVPLIRSPESAKARVIYASAFCPLKCQLMRPA